MIFQMKEDNYKMIKIAFFHSYVLHVLIEILLSKYVFDISIGVQWVNKTEGEKNNDVDVAGVIFHGSILFVFRQCVYHQHITWHYKGAKLLKEWENSCQRSKLVMQ